MSGQPKDASGHPDVAELEALRTGEAGPDVVRHVESCDECRAGVRDTEALAAGLRVALTQPEIDVPSDVDAAIRAAARGRASGIAVQAARRARRRRLLYFSWPGWVAAAAVALIAVGLFSMSTRRKPQGEASGEASLADGAPDAAVSPSPQATLASRPAVASGMDIDRSGGVDIVDAYLLSRRLRRRERVPRSFDFDRDGRVSDADVRAVAARAVALAGGGI